MLLIITRNLIYILIRIINDILNTLSARVFTLYLIININIIRYKLSIFIYKKL